MPLDLYIYGPGYGESIILHWHSDGVEGCMVVDAFLPKQGEGWTLQKLRALGIRRVDLLAATHPHLDHVRFIHRVVAEFSIGAVWWWGGWDKALYAEYFDLLAREDPAAAQRERALSVKTFFTECQQRLPNSATGAGKVGEFKASCNVTSVLSQSVNGHPLIEVFAVSPWADSLARFTITLAKAHLERRDLRGGLNQASLGFIVNYGESQIFLGGDMEEENWNELRARWASLRREWEGQEKRFPQLKPHVVKVCHHGSRNSCLPGMWGVGGYLAPEDHPPIAVITPWDRAPEGRRLPNQDVIETIRRSGARVFVSAPTRLVATPVRSSEEFPHLHLQIPTQGRPRVRGRGESEEFPPLPPAAP